MYSHWDIITELESDNSRLFKESIITREAAANNTEFFDGIKLALDPMITFGIKQAETKTNSGRGLTWSTFVQLLEALSSRQLTGNKATNAVAHARMNATEVQWNNWYRRILLKDLRCGISDKTVNNALKDYPVYTIPIFSTQLAQDGANPSHTSHVSGQKLIESKLDGVRVITVVYPTGRVDQYSRNGKELLNFEKIKQQIAKHALFFSEPVVLDGEVMSASFQDLMKQVNRKENVETDDAVLQLFDILTLKEFKRGYGDFRQIDRSVTLAAWHSQFPDHMPNVEVIGHELIDLDTEEGQTRYAKINADALAYGYEGIMLKDPLAIYECKRSVSWIKVKPFMEVSLTIDDVEEGDGKNIESMGALVCSGVDDGKDIRVNVGGGFTSQLRAQIWANFTNKPVNWTKIVKKEMITYTESPTGDPIVGQVVEVRADAITQNQDGTYSLRFPRFRHFRGYTIGEKL